MPVYETDSKRLVSQRDSRSSGPTDVAKPTYRENKRSYRAETDYSPRNKKISSRDRATLQLLNAVMHY
jgi:hypothetical protein